jgi:hypothetical protein
VAAKGIVQAFLDNFAGIWGWNLRTGSDAFISESRKYNRWYIVEYIKDLRNRIQNAALSKVNLFKLAVIK